MKFPQHVIALALAQERKQNAARTPKEATADAPERQRTSPGPKKGMNKTETAYYHILMAEAGEGLWDHVFEHESIKVKVGAYRCWYTPDFATEKDGRITFHEVKGGFVRDDARVKFQAAVKQYPQFGWTWAQRVKGRWEIK
jgi:hypothetical protein